MQIQTTDQLRALYKAPSERAVLKELMHIDSHLKRFISLSPFLVISSGDQHHQNIDAMPTLGEIIRDQTKRAGPVESRKEMLKRYTPDL